MSRPGLGGLSSHVDAGDRVDKYRRLTRVGGMGSGPVGTRWVSVGCIGRAAGVLWKSEECYCRFRLGMGLLLRVVRAKVGFLVDVASADIAVMGRVQDMGRGRIGV